MRGRPLIDRFHDKYFVHPTTGCWLWTGFTSHAGYGLIKGPPPDLRILKAHRVSYEAFNGPITEGLVVDHVCNTKRCVNPEHLQLLTPRENIMRSNHPTIVALWLNQCVRGHDLSDPANVIMNTDGVRRCRVCRRVRDKRNKAKARAARRQDAA